MKKLIVAVIFSLMLCSCAFTGADIAGGVSDALIDVLIIGQE